MTMSTATKTEREVPKKLPLQHRSLPLTRDMLDEEKRTVEVAFSSAHGVMRWYGEEVLSHDKGAVRMERMQDGAAVLANHDYDQHIGVVEEASIDKDKMGRAVIRFGKSALAEEKMQAVKDGILRHVSVGYIVHKAQREEADDKAVPTYRITDWEPVEISLVAVPADPTVGVGRAQTSEEFPLMVEGLAERKIETTATAEIAKEATMSTQVTPAAAAAVIDPTEVINAERARVSEITALARQFKVKDEAVREFIDKGTDVGSVRKAIMDQQVKDSQARDITSGVGGLVDDMVKEEGREFCITKAIRVAAGETGDALKFERDLSDQLAKTLKREVPKNTILVPTKRVLNKGTTTAGGYTVATELLGLIELIRNKMKVRALGATVLSGLSSNIAIPRHTTASVANWKPESGPSVAADAVFDQVTLSPHKLTAATSFTMELLQQSSIDVEAFVRNDLALVMSLALDLASIAGTGANDQPTGILGQTGIGSVVTGGAPLTYDNFIDMETALGVANFDEATVAFLTTPGVRGKLKKTAKMANMIAEAIWGQDGKLLGYRSEVSNQVPKTLQASADRHAVILGDWAQLLIGEFGVMEILVDPAIRFAYGEYVVNARLLADIAVRHPQGFVAIQDADPLAV